MFVYTIVSPGKIISGDVVVSGLNSPERSGGCVSLKSVKVSVNTKFSTVTFPVFVMLTENVTISPLSTLPF